MKLFQLFIIMLFFGQSLGAQQEYHVAKTGHGANSGTIESPFLTIQKAADVAQPGDVITVCEGIYRERVTPTRGGVSNRKRITYQTAEGEKVVIKGSEIVKGWEEFLPDVWKATLPNSFFGDYNPFKDIIKGDWFHDLGRVHHTGEVYLNEKSLWESATLEGVLDPKRQEDKFDPEGSTYTWYTESDNENTYIYANFQGADPNEELVEINVRESCFYPDTTGINYITVRGFQMMQAATQWAPPTAEQIGLIGTFWSKGWIIEDNVIRNSKCSGITLGKDRASGHNVWIKNPERDGAVVYNEVIDKAVESGWSKETIGSHIVRNNTISECGQTGICGSMGAIFSVVENNNIYNIWTKRQFAGHEMAGIKFHAPIDMIIKGNRVVNTGRGIWLDWMVQGTRVTGNILYNNVTNDYYGTDLYFEVNHGPYLVDNNILLSKLALRDDSKGGAFVHNLIGGRVQTETHLRETPYHLPHSTEVVGLDTNVGGDNRYYNNIFIGGIEAPKYDNSALIYSGLKAYNHAELPMFVDRNVYLNGANVYQFEKHFLELDYDPRITIIEEDKNVFLSMKFDERIIEFKNPFIYSEFLGKAMLANQGYVNPDGSSLKISSDYWGEKRKKRNPTAGPFENPISGQVKLKVWGD